MFETNNEKAFGRLHSFYIKHSFYFTPFDGVVELSHQYVFAFVFRVCLHLRLSFVYALSHIERLRT